MISAVYHGEKKRNCFILHMHMYMYSNRPLPQVEQARAFVHVLINEVVGKESSTPLFAPLSKNNTLYLTRNSM